MAILKTVKSGESFSMGIILPDDYVLLYAQEIKIYIGGQECAHTIIDRMIKCELTSNYTATLFGDKTVEFWLDDMNWGVRKYTLGNIRFISTSAEAHNESINTGYDITITLSITESTIEITDIMYNYSKGDSAFQTWLLIPGNEDKTWNDFVSFIREPTTEATQAAWDATFTASLATTASIIATTSSSIATQASIIATESASLATQYSLIATESSSLATQASIIATESASIATANTIIATTSSSIATQASIIATESASLATQYCIITAESASNVVSIATEIADHPDTIIDDYWWKWRIDANMYENTGIKAKGDPFLYSDFTPEQIAELQQPATDAIASIEAVELVVETAEGLRVQAELNRQTNTATAIQNAETATTNAGNAASLANEKAGLANDAAILANEKAGLAATATTQANEARDGANSAAESATNLVNSYATDLAAKVAKTDIEQVRSQATDKVASSKLLDDELTALNTEIETKVSELLAATVYISANDYQMLIDNNLVEPDVEYNIYEE